MQQGNVDRPDETFPDQTGVQGQSGLTSDVSNTAIESNHRPYRVKTPFRTASERTEVIMTHRQSEFRRQQFDVFRED